jgi:hypothetical protein
MLPILTRTVLLGKVGRCQKKRLQGGYRLQASEQREVMRFELTVVEQPGQRFFVSVSNVKNLFFAMEDEHLCTAYQLSAPKLDRHFRLPSDRILAATQAAFRVCSKSEPSISFHNESE